jgi:hypothetical protein
MSLSKQKLTIILRTKGKKKRHIVAVGRENVEIGKFCGYMLGRERELR